MPHPIRSSIPALVWPAALLGSVAVHAALFVNTPPQSLGDVPRPAGRPVAIAGTLAGIIGSASTATPVETAEPVKPVATQTVETATPVIATPAPPTPVPSATASLAPVVEARPTPQAPADTATLASPQPVKPAPEAAKPAPAPDRTRQVRDRESQRKKAEQQRKKAERRRKKEAARKASRAGGRVQGAAGARSGGRGGTRAASAGAVRSYGLIVRARILSNRPGGAGGFGRTVISFGLSPSGGLRYASVARSSGNRSLDALALRAVRRSAPFPRPPQAASPSQLRFSIAFSFN